jgi:hypothetical protein
LLTRRRWHAWWFMIAWAFCLEWCGTCLPFGAGKIHPDGHADDSNREQVDLQFRLFRFRVQESAFFVGRPFQAVKKPPEKTAWKGRPTPRNGRAIIPRPPRGNPPSSFGSRGGYARTRMSPEIAWEPRRPKPVGPQPQAASWPRRRVDNAGARPSEYAIGEKRGRRRRRDAKGSPRSIRTTPDGLGSAPMPPAREKAAKVTAKGTATCEPLFSPGSF